MATPIEYGPVKQAGEGVVIQLYLCQVPKVMYLIDFCTASIDSTLHNLTHIKSMFLKASCH